MLSIHDAGPRHPIELFRDKWAAEEALRASRLAWTIIRPTAYLEAWLGLVGRPLVETGRTRIFGTGRNPINFVSVVDVAQFVQLAIADSSLRQTAIEVPGPENLTLDQLAALAETASGCSGRKDHVPRPMMRAVRLAMRILNPTMSALVDAALVMDTIDMPTVPRCGGISVDPADDEVGGCPPDVRVDLGERRTRDGESRRGRGRSGPGQGCESHRGFVRERRVSVMYESGSCGRPAEDEGWARAAKSWGMFSGIAFAIATLAYLVEATGLIGSAPTYAATAAGQLQDEATYWVALFAYRHATLWDYALRDGLFFFAFLGFIPLVLAGKRGDGRAAGGGPDRRGVHRRWRDLRGAQRRRVLRRRQLVARHGLGAGPSGLMAAIGRGTEMIDDLSAWSGIASNAALAIGLGYLGIACMTEPALSRPIGWVGLRDCGARDRHRRGWPDRWPWTPWRTF